MFSDKTIEFGNTGAAVSAAVQLLAQRFSRGSAGGNGLNYALLADFKAGADKLAVLLLTIIWP